MTKLTDAVFKNGVREEAKMQTADELNSFFTAVKRNLDILTAMMENYNKTTDNSFTELSSIENDLTMFTFKGFDVSKYYTENMTGECVITKVGHIAGRRCHIADLHKYIQFTDSFSCCVCLT